MRITLHRQDYEKSKDLAKIQYTTWNVKKNDFVPTSERGFEFNILNIKKMSTKQKEELKEVLDKWKLKIQEEDIKLYGKYMNSTQSKELYCGIAENVNSYLFNINNILFLDDDDKIRNMEDEEFFCSTIKNYNTYLSIGIFSIHKTNESARLDLSLAYPRCQSIRVKRKNGTFGACGHNSRMQMINYIFSQKNVNKIHSNPVNYSIGKSLEKIGFKY